MPETKLTLNPGIDRQKTQTLNQGGWSDSSLVRFRDGMPQKWFGWQSAITSTLDAVCRGLFSWMTLAGVASLAIGTARRINLVQGSTLFDITPIDTSGTLANNPFATTISTTTVTVTHASHGRSPGDIVQFSGATVVTGITMTPGSGFSEYVVLTVPNGNTYTVTGPQTASGTSAGGGGAAVLFRYYIPSGTSDAIFGAGWGAGPWGGVGAGPISTLGANPFTSAAAGAGAVIVTVTDTVSVPPHVLGIGDRVTFSGATGFDGISAASLNAAQTILTVPTSTSFTFSTTTTTSAGASGGGAAVMASYNGSGWGAAATSSIKSQSPRTVSFDNWGEDLIINPHGLAIYQWDASLGTATRATVLTATDAPNQVNCILVAIPERHLVAYGCNNPLTSLAFDPLLIRWSDVETYNVNGDWTATALNSAGSFRLASGNRIMRAIRSVNGILVLTDDVAYLQSFIGSALVYAFRPQGAGSGLISVNAAIDVNGTVYWWGTTGFFVWNGATRKIESALHNDLFGTGTNSFDRLQAEKIYAGLDSSNNEIHWFYPSTGGTGECDRVLTYNFAEGLWYASTLPRTAYIDRAIFPNPIGIDDDGAIFFHEIGVDDDGAAMSVYIESGYVDMSGGGQLLYIDRIIPDFADFTGTLQITFKGQQYPDGPITTKGPYSINSATKFVRCPIRARQVAIRIASSTVGDWWRLGAVRVKSQTDGRVY